MAIVFTCIINYSLHVGLLRTSTFTLLCEKQWSINDGYNDKLQSISTAKARKLGDILRTLNDNCLQGFNNIYFKGTCKTKSIVDGNILYVIIYKYLFSSNTMPCVASGQLLLLTNKIAIFPWNRIYRPRERKSYSKRYALFPRSRSLCFDPRYPAGNPEVSRSCVRPVWPSSVGACRVLRTDRLPLLFHHQPVPVVRTSIDQSGHSPTISQEAQE